MHHKSREHLLGPSPATHRGPSTPEAKRVTGGGEGGMREGGREGCLGDRREDREKKFVREGRRRVKKENQLRTDNTRQGVQHLKSGKEERERLDIFVC